VDLDFDGAEPLYRQLAAVLREQIRSGELAPNRPIPSKTHLRQLYGVSDSTVKAAIALLREEDLIVGVTGKGIFVRQRA
jgi:GntR family transcriptional regulator